MEVAFCKPNVVFREWSCWDRFSLLSASWAHLVPLTAFVGALGRFLCVLGRSGLDFGGFRGVPGEFWRLRGVIFRGFFVPVRLSCEKCWIRVSYCKNQYETHVGDPALHAKNYEKWLSEPSKQNVLLKRCRKCLLGLAWLDVGVPRCLP